MWPFGRKYTTKRAAGQNVREIVISVQADGAALDRTLSQLREIVDAATAATTALEYLVTAEHAYKNGQVSCAVCRGWRDPEAVGLDGVCKDCASFYRFGVDRLQSDLQLEESPFEMDPRYM